MTYDGVLAEVIAEPTPMADILATLSRYPIKTRLSLSGPMIVARDLAHVSRADAVPILRHLDRRPVHFGKRGNQ